MKLVKYLLLILLFVGAAGMAGLYALQTDIGYWTEAVKDVYSNNPWLFTVAQGLIICLGVGVFFLFIASITKPVSKKQIIRQRKQGKMQFSLRTLETLAIASVRDIVPLQEHSIQAKFFISKKERVKVRLRLSADQPIQQVSGKSAAIEKQIIDSFNHMLQLEVTEVTLSWIADKNASNLLTEKELKVS